MAIRLASIGLLLLTLLAGSGATARAASPDGGANLWQARAAALWLCRQVAATEPGLAGWRACLVEARAEARPSVQAAVSEQRDALRSEVEARVDSAEERAEVAPAAVGPTDTGPSCQTEREEANGTLRETTRCEESRTQVVSSPSGTVSISQVQSLSSVTVITSNSSSNAN